MPSHDPGFAKAKADARTPEALAEQVAHLRSPEAIRERCEKLFRLAEEGKLADWELHLENLPAVTRYVLAVIQEQYPTLDIPLHARWRHFDVGGQPRVAHLNDALARLSTPERAMAKLDLAITSVLLDAGAGSAWTYREETTGATYARSEGLAVASYRMFMAGSFSSEAKHPWRVDAERLLSVTEEDIRKGFQVSQDNPLVGVAGRAELLRSLGQALREHPELFGGAPPRPGGLYGHFAGARHQGTTRVQASALLRAVLDGFASIWPGRVCLGSANLGDVWHHPALGAAEQVEALVPFHKLSQWLTYSLVEPFVEAGVPVEGLEKLTGLPEYRNGGLFVDGGVLVPRDPSVVHRAHAPGSPLVVAWRALTVALLDRVGLAVREALGKSAAEFPLAKVLEGGTWAAGRRMAAEKRPGGGPPLAIESDGTVF
jgi:hypothetical protein